MKINIISILLAVALLACFIVCVYPKNTPAAPGFVVEAVAVSPARTGEAANSAPAQPSQKITLWQAAVLGVVEGLTEYLPVSSTGHLILANHAMGMSQFSQEKSPLGGKKLLENSALDSFDVVIQLGAILAVLGLYRRRVGQMFGGLSAGTAALIARRPAADMDERYRTGLKLVILLLIAFLPAAIVGKLYHKKIEEYLFGPLPVAYALIVGGVLMMVVEYFFYRRNRHGRERIQIDQMQYWQALAIGLAQCLAMWPGTSRSMITMIAALVVGLDMVAAAEFSFLLALPTLGAATVYSGLIHRHELLHASGLDGLLVGLVISGIVAAIAVKAFVKWLTHHGMIPFGIYRILLAGVLLLYFWKAE